MHGAADSGCGADGAELHLGALCALACPLKLPCLLPHRTGRFGHSTRLLKVLTVLEDSYQVAGVNNSGEDKPSTDGRSWIRLFFDLAEASDDPQVKSAIFYKEGKARTTCCADGCGTDAVAGGHLWLFAANGGPIFKYCVIAPVCSKHNNPKKTHYDPQDKDCGFKLKRGAVVVAISVHACYTDLPPSAAQPPACGPTCGCQQAAAPCGQAPLT